MSEIENLKNLLQETEQLANEIRGSIAKLEAETETERFQRVCANLGDAFKPS